MERSGLSENIVRDMVDGENSHNKSSWVALCGALEFLPASFLKVLDGKADVSVLAESPMEQRLAQMVSELAEIGALRQDVDVLKDVVYRIDKKIDIMISVRDSAGGGRPPAESSQQGRGRGQDSAQTSPWLP
jgi:hypothetical protein